MSENDVIPEDKIREAHAKCMQDPALAKYFDEAPPGARQYIALMFYCTVFQDEVDDAKCELYQSEVEEDLTKEDLLYLATNERNLESRAHFRELYVKMANEEQAREAEAAAAAPVVSVDTDGVVRAVAELRAETHQVRRLVAELATRENGAPGALTLGVLSVLLLIAASVTPQLTRTVVIGFVLASSLFGLCAAVRETREFKPCRIGGAVLAGASLLGALGMLFLIGMGKF